MLPANLFARVLHQMTRGNYYSLGGTAILPSLGVFVTCKLFSILHVRVLQNVGKF